MSWEIFSQQDVQDNLGIAADSFDDSHYDDALSFAEEWMGRKLGGSATYTAEKHDGDGSDTLFVDHPPIVSVSALTIDDASMGASSYEVYGAYIRLTSLADSALFAAIAGPLVYFPVGAQNISITYVGGYAVASVPARVRRGLMLLAAHFALFRSRAGADASQVFDTAQPRDGGSDQQAGQPLSKEEAIARQWLGRRIRIG